MGLANLQKQVGKFVVVMSISEYRIPRNRFLIGTSSVFRIRFICKEKLRVINRFRRCAKTQVRARSRVCVITRWLSEVLRNLLERLSVVCTTCICIYSILEPYLFHVFLKFKKAKPAVSSMTTPPHVCFEFIALYFLCYL